VKAYLLQAGFKPLHICGRNKSIQLMLETIQHSGCSLKISKLFGCSHRGNFYGHMSHQLLSQGALGRNIGLASFVELWEQFIMLQPIQATLVHFQLIRQHFSFFP
jgi:hypothetical protein